jgi:2-hydroxychromene-2-carboxylate isomerase
MKSSKFAPAAADRLGRVIEFSKRLFGPVFGTDVAPTDDAGLARIADAAGLDGQELVRLIDDPETAWRHERTIVDARAVGVFGVPGFVVDGEMFLGNDRPILLRRCFGARS